MLLVLLFFCCCCCCTCCCQLYLKLLLFATCTYSRSSFFFLVFSSSSLHLARLTLIRGSKVKPKMKKNRRNQKEKNWLWEKRRSKVSKLKSLNHMIKRRTNLAIALIAPKHVSFVPLNHIHIQKRRKNSQIHLIEEQKREKWWRSFTLL